MKEGDSFTVPLENGAFLKQIFYKDYSVLRLKRPNMEESEVISKKDSYKKEYSYLLGYTNALEDSQLGIGPRFPNDFLRTLRNIKAGQVLIFENGKSYVCEYNKDNVLRLVKTSDDVYVPHISEFQKSEAFSVNLTDNIGIQHLYAQMRNMYTDDVEFRTTTTYKAQELLNKCLAGLDKQTKVLQIGPNKIRVKKSVFGKNLVYYDENGTKISEDSVKVLLGWLNAAPVITEFDRKQYTEKSFFDDTMFKSDLSLFLSAEEFHIASGAIETYMKENGNEDLSIKFHSYDKNATAVSFIFKHVDNKIKIYKAIYQDNDYSKDVKTIKEASFSEFETFCKQKYNEHQSFVKTDINDVSVLKERLLVVDVKSTTLNDILERYPQ